MMVGASFFLQHKQPIQTPAIMQARSFEVMNNELYVGMVEALGGNATAKCVHSELPIN